MKGVTVTAALAACLALVAGCGGSDDGSPRSGTRTPSATPTFGQTLADLQRFADLRIPSDARDPSVTATPSTTVPGRPVYKARFTTTRQGARSFCAGLGGDLPRTAPLDAQTRQRFGIQGESGQTPRHCESITPQMVQRQAIVTFPDDGDTAVVHVIAYPTPAR